MSGAELGCTSTAACKTATDILNSNSKQDFPGGDMSESGDKIVPLHHFDDGPLWRAFILYSLFVLDHVLDAEKLRTSLERLIRKKGWQKLGARLKQNVSSSRVILLSYPRTMLVPNTNP